MSFIVPVTLSTGRTYCEFEDAGAEVYPHLGVPIFRTQTSRGSKYFKVFEWDLIPLIDIRSSIELNIPRRNGTLLSLGLVPLGDGDDENWEIVEIHKHAYLDGFLHYYPVYKALPGYCYEYDADQLGNAQGAIKEYTRQLKLREPLPRFERNLTSANQKYAGTYSPWDAARASRQPVRARETQGNRRQAKKKPTKSDRVSKKIPASRR